ncbi:MAG TPA: glycerophosphodiester phosphodiesterase family protein [Mycobacteriales bacterium]|nr:glycerophosphodiester phosphodiesterase family protein [Mycobacteriales bacterium]
MRTRLLTLALPLLVAAGLPASAVEPTARPDSPVLNIAHRGASGLAPEHTIAAYDLGLALGADLIEQDAQLTADGVLVALHDATLDRTARGPAENCTGRVATKTLAQLRTCDVGTWFNERYPDRARPEFAGARIPTMSEVFSRYGDGVAYHVEIKDGDPRSVRELLRLLDVHGLRDDAHTSWRVLLQSFNPADLLLARTLDPALPTVQLLAAAPPAGPARDVLLDRVATYADGVGPSAGGVDAAFVQAAHARCLQVHPYTVDDADRLRALVDAGVDGVFTNRPDVLDEVLFPDRSQVRAEDAGVRNAAAAAGRSRDCNG